MVNPTNTVVDAEQGTELPLTFAALLAAMSNLDVDQAKARQTIVRENFRGMLEGLHTETGTKSVDILLPNGEKIGAASFSDTKDTTKLFDERALTNWVMDHDDEGYWADAVETVVRIRPTFQARLLKDVIWAPRTETKPKFEWVPVTDDAGNLLNEDGKPVQDGEKPDQVWAPVMGEGGKQVEEEVPVLDGNGEPIYDAIHGPTGELIPGLHLQKGKTDTSKFTIRMAKPKAGAAAVVGESRDGAQMLAEFMANNPIETMIPNEIEALVVAGE